ncbi:unnamed protein product, partial [Pylaiella littoralis]
ASRDQSAPGAHGAVPERYPHALPRTEGSGKKTLVREMLRGMYGPGAGRVKTERRCVTTTSAKQSIEIDAVVSAHHMEIEPADAGVLDRYVVQDVIRGMASSGSIAAAMSSSCVTHRTIVFLGADGMTRQAQAGLRRTMETHSGSCRLVLVCANPSRIMDPLRSRCVLVRVPLPAARDLLRALSHLGEPLAREIVEKSGRSISKAFFMARQGSLEPCAWEQYVGSICSGVFLEQSPGKLLGVRDSLNELIASGLPSSVILKKLMHDILKRDDAPDSIKRRL